MSLYTLMVNLHILSIIRFIDKFCTVEYIFHINFSHVLEVYPSDLKMLKIRRIIRTKISCV